MTLKKSFGIFAIATSLFLLAFDVYWYTIKYHDLSSFLAFGCTSLLGISVGIIFIEISKEISGVSKEVKDLKGDVAYVESKALEHIEGEQNEEPKTEDNN